MVRNALLITTAIAAAFIALLAFYSATVSAIQVFNPSAVFAAIAVAVAGIVWFKKTTK
jgi:hypothetical protein